VNRENRAKQFMPFDALKGLSQALRMKEYEHDRVVKSDLSEEKVLEISNVLSNLKKNDVVEVKYFNNGHYLILKGNCLVDIVNKKITVDSTCIDFDDIFNIKKIKGI